MIHMRFAYNLLIINLLFVCLWFAYTSVKSNAYYRKIFRWLMWAGILLYANRMIEIAMEDGFIPCNDILLNIERSIHYVLTVIIYELYAFFMFCLIDQFHYFHKWKKLLLFIPGTLMCLMIITSPVSCLIFYVEDGVCYEGKLFFVMSFIRAAYAIIATIHAIVKRHLMPRIFGQSVILVAFFAAIQGVVFWSSHDETLYYTTLIVNIITFLLALTVVEFYKDSLTGLLNREAFEQYAQKEIGRKGHKAVYLVKLKNYEYIKDNCRETSLLVVIKKLGECIKEYATLPSVYYLGVGRYAIIVHKRDKFVEEEFFEKLRERFDITFDLNGINIHLNLFIAVMNMDNGKISKDNFYKYFSACDDIKYRSKEPIEVIYSDSLGIDQLQRYRNVEEAIERAVVEKEFRIFYQPIVSTETKKIISAEALIRLNDRVLGYISPEEFIPISESNGKIIEISEYVIDNVFRFVKDNPLKDMGIEFVELNLSVMQCMDKKLTEKLEYYINKYEIDPKQVNLEITETAAIFDEDRLRRQLAKIKQLGFSFSLDDYGTGYSNLVRVLEYPVDVIKLDKSIVWSAFHDRDNYVTLKNLISMFHDVRRKIVAEGVESEEQMITLTELGCDYLQGYYYSKPVSEEEFLTFVARYNII